MSLTVGGAQNDSQSEQSSVTQRSAQVTAGGNINLTASGDQSSSDITVVGSTITAGGQATLSAAHDINLLGAQEIDEQHSKNSSLSYGAGLAIEFKQGGGAAFGVTANAAGSRGNSDGTDVSQVMSTISGSNGVSLISGHDTTLQGALVSGKQVTAQVGNNLNIISVQDTSTYGSKSQSLSGSVTGGLGFSASANASMSKVNADFASVAQQSGIAAGDGGFQLQVAGNTDLQGGKISSTQAAIDSNLNSLSTGSLTASNIANHSQYQAASISVGTGAGGGAGTSGGIGYSAGSQGSVTQASISGAQITVTDADQQAQTGNSASAVLASLDRTVLTGKDSSNSLIKNWDGQAFGQQAAKAIGNYATSQLNSLNQQIDAESDPDKKAALQAEAAKWAEGGAYRVALHTATGALTGGLGGALGAAVSSSAMPEIAKAIDTLGLPDAVAKGLEQVTASALGAMVGGAAGAVSGVTVEANNRQLHTDEKTLAKQLAASSNGKYTEQQIEDAMRAASNNALGESVSTGATVNVDGSKATVYDDGSKWFVVGQNGTQQLVQQIPLNVSADIMAYIQQSTGNTYSWSAAQNYALSMGNPSSVRNPYAQANCSGTQCTVVAAPPLLSMPDYLSAQANFYVISGGVAINLHDGEMFGQWGLGRQYPGYTSTPGVSIVAGKIWGRADAAATSNFLAGGGGSASYFYPIPAISFVGVGGGINYSYGGKTAIEGGISIPPGAGVNPVGYGFQLNKNGVGK